MSDAYLQERKNPNIFRKFKEAWLWSNDNQDGVWVITKKRNGRPGAVDQCLKDGSLSVYLFGNIDYWS